MSKNNQRCRYCGSDMSRTSTAGYAQNPWCNGCYDERIAKHVAERGPMVWEFVPGTDNKWARAVPLNFEGEGI